MLTDNLRDDYIENRNKIDDEWPPDQPKTVVNVALIHYKGSRTEQEFIEISKRHKKGTEAVDELAHHSRVTKDIAKIFKADFTKDAAAFGKHPPKFILIEGAPGIGKTVLAKNIAYLWAEKKLLTDVNILFLMFLRDPELQTVRTSADLVQYLSLDCFDEEQTKDCVKQIRKLKVGFVMDGYDEYPASLRKKSFIANLIKGKVFHNFIVVLTSRPTATISLHNKVDRRVEILGFAQEERDKYISVSLCSSEQRKKLQDYLVCHPIINGLIYVPLHLAVLLYLFKAQSELPETLTEMNESFILHTIYRSLTRDRLTLTSPVAIVSIKDLPGSVSMIVNKLSKIAFTGLQSNRLVFTHAEIEADFPEIKHDILGAPNVFGLLQAVQHFPKKGIGTTISYNFLHFTMQEYLAALYASSISHQRQLSLMKKTFWDSLYSFMWMMYIGINGINSQSFVTFLYKAQPGANLMKLQLSSDIESDKLKCLHLFQCFMEAKSESVPKEISSIFHNNKINFHGVQLLPYHISSLTLYISKYSVQLQSLNLRDCHIGDIGMNILEHFFTTNPDKASNIKHIDLFGNNSVLLWNVYCAIFGQKNLTKLNWSSLGRVKVEEVITVMDNNTTVLSLDISDNHFTEDDAEKIAEVLSKNTTLQEFNFSNNCVAIDISQSVQKSANFQHFGMIKFSKALKTNTSLHLLDISHNNIYDDGLAAISEFIKNIKSLQILDISHNNISAVGAAAISKNRTFKKLNMSYNKIDSFFEVDKALQTNTTLQILDLSHNNMIFDHCGCLDKNNLKELNLSYNRISNNGIVKLGEVLKAYRTLQILDLSHNDISNGVAVSSCLKSNSLKELNLSYNKVPNSGIIDICKALQMNVTLQLLDISYNKIFDESILTFSDYLKEKNTLQKLRISWNNDICLSLDSMVQSCAISKMRLGDTGAILVSAFLYRNSIIQELDISRNNISDDGAVAISEYLKCYNYTLKKLYISYNEITIYGVIAILSNIDSWLRILDLTHNIISKPDLIMISNTCKKHKNLQISYNEIVDNSQTVNTNLVHFHNKDYDQFTVYSRIKLDNRSASYKAKVLCFCAKDDHSVKILDISNLNVTNELAGIICKAIKGNTSLQKLDISHNNISDDGAIAIGECLQINGTLQEFNLSHNNISNSGIIDIGKALQVNTTLLRSLDISYNKIFDDGIITFSDYIKKRNNLQKIKISWINGIYLVLDSMVQSCTVSKMRLGNTGTILVSAFLHHNTTIQKLDISHNNISNDGAVAISECLKNNNTMQELNLSHNIISNYEIISEALLTNTMLQILNVSHNNIPNWTSFGNRLKELNLSHNRMSDHKALSIGNALKVNKTLQLLDISHNKLSDHEILTFSDYLKYDKTLHQLRISWNNIYLVLDSMVQSCILSKMRLGNTGAILVSAFLYRNTNIQKLDISHNNISDDGAVVISECLKENNTLQELNLSHNVISNYGVVNICRALKVNATIRLLDISNNKLFNKRVNTLRKRDKRNPVILILIIFLAVVCIDLFLDSIGVEPVLVLNAAVAIMLLPIIIGTILICDHILENLPSTHK